MNGSRPLLQVLISIAAGLVLALLISEVTYRFNTGGGERAPMQVELVIPPGTADRVSSGETVETLPEEMSFIEGDELVVINRDDTSHQLGPIWVPANSSGSIFLDRADQYSYDCTFQPNRFMGLDVRPRVTAGSRLQAMLILGLPMGGLLAVYSFVLTATRQKKIEA